MTSHRPGGDPQLPHAGGGTTPRLSICAGAPSRRRRITCLTSRRHSSRTDDMTPSRNRGGRKRLADSLPPDGPVTRPSPVPLITDPGTPRSAVSHMHRGDRGGESLTGSRNQRSPPPDAGSSNASALVLTKVLGTSSRWRASSRRRVTRGRATSASSNDMTSYDHQHARPLRKCRRSPTPAPSRLKNPLQYTSPSRSSRIQDSLVAPKRRQCFKARQLGCTPSGLVFRANTTTSSNDPSIYNTRIKLTTPLPRTSLASATPVVLASATQVVSSNRIIHSPLLSREGESGETTPCRNIHSP